MPTNHAPIDTDTLLVTIDQDIIVATQARKRLALASLGLIAARIRADHPEARYVELGFSTDMKTYQGRTETGRVWLPGTEQAGRWRACLDEEARADLDGWCVHIGGDVEELLPTIWHKDEWTGLNVVDLDAIVAALGAVEGEQR